MSPADKEEYALIASREGRPTGCKAAREETRGRSLWRGQVIPDGVQPARARPIQRKEASGDFARA